jgi:hemoglobin
MNKDITDRADIELLINSFYDVVRKDEAIGYIFNDIIGDDWSHHLPIMYQFWESILFSKPGYSGNPIKKHIDIDKRMPLEQAHFTRWLELWNAAVDNLFEGENAAQAKNRAMLMANLINMKVVMSHNDGFIQ